MTLWEQGNTINGYQAVVSNQLTDGDIFFGNFADCMIGYWSGVDLNVDTAALAKSGGLRIIVLQDVDFAVRHAESFCLGQ
jgi:HK97 family phage major capsid protein